LRGAREAAVACERAFAGVHERRSEIRRQRRDAADDGQLHVEPGRSVQRGDAIFTG
jgi:hypothetical protein